MVQPGRWSGCVRDLWENETDERASQADIAVLVERMADVLASYEVDQEICEVVHEQYPAG